MVGFPRRYEQTFGPLFLLGMPHSHIMEVLFLPSFTESQVEFLILATLSIYPGLTESTCRARKNPFLLQPVIRAARRVFSPKKQRQRRDHMGWAELLAARRQLGGLVVGTADGRGGNERRETSTDL